MSGNVYGVLQKQCSMEWKQNVNHDYFLNTKEYKPIIKKQGDKINQLVNEINKIKHAHYVLERQYKYTEGIRKKQEELK